MTIECSCGFSCGTEAAFERHLSRGLPGDHHRADGISLEHCTSLKNAHRALEDEVTRCLDVGEDRQRQTARLVTAIETADIAAVCKALDAGADIDGSARTGNITTNHPLTIAAIKGHRNVVAQLLARRASILSAQSRGLRNEPHPSGSLHLAIAYSKLQTASVLLEHMTHQPHVIRDVSGMMADVLGPRREVACSSAQTHDLLATIFRELRATSRPTALFAMLVADGHLQATEPAGLKGLALRLAGKPSKWLAAHLTQLLEDIDGKIDLSVDGPLGRARRGHRKPGARTNGFQAIDSELQALAEQFRLCLVQGARPRWSPSSHRLYPAAFRRMVLAVLLSAHRMAGESGGPGQPDGVNITHEVQTDRRLLGALPPEVLVVLMEWLSERTFWVYESDSATC